MTSVASPIPRTLLVAAAFAAGCATQPGAGAVADAAPSTTALELEPPEHGFQVQTLGVVVEPGEDVRWCEVVELPGSPDRVYHVNRIETAMAPYGNDLVINAAVVGSETEAIMDPGARVPCTRAGEAFGEELSEVTATRHAYEDRRFHDGVGKIFRGGQRLAVDYHYFNEGEEPLGAKAKINFHTVDAELVERIAHTASFQNLTIYTPPGGTSSHVAECLVSQDLLVGELVRRTQRRGTSFTVWLAGGERDGELLWRSAGPEDTRYELDEPLQLTDGEGFRFQCDYYNDSELELRFGVNASDEMCELDAQWWVATDGEEAEVQGCLALQLDDDGVARD
jgi:hypothetical protein